MNNQYVIRVACNGDWKYLCGDAEGAILDFCSIGEAQIYMSMYTKHTNKRMKISPLPDWDIMSSMCIKESEL